MNLNRRPDDSLCDPVDLIDFDHFSTFRFFYVFLSVLSVFSVVKRYIYFLDHLRGLVPRLRSSAGAVGPPVQILPGGTVHLALCRLVHNKNRRVGEAPSLERPRPLLVWSLAPAPGTSFEPL